MICNTLSVCYISTTIMDLQRTRNLSECRQASPWWELSGVGELTMFRSPGFLSRSQAQYWPCKMDTCDFLSVSSRDSYTRQAPSCLSLCSPVLLPLSVPPQLVLEKSWMLQVPEHYELFHWTLHRGPFCPDWSNPSPWILFSTTTGNTSWLVWVLQSLDLTYCWISHTDYNVSVSSIPLWFSSSPSLWGSCLSHLHNILWNTLNLEQSPWIFIESNYLNSSHIRSI